MGNVQKSKSVSGPFEKRKVIFVKMSYAWTGKVYIDSHHLPYFIASYLTTSCQVVDSSLVEAYMQKGKLWYNIENYKEIKL